MPLFPVFSPVAAAVVSSTYVANTTSDALQQTHTFTDHAIGTAADDRKIVVLLAVYGGPAPSMAIADVTIGGTSATQELTQRPSASGYDRDGVEIWSLNVSSGTTATIVVDAGHNIDEVNIGVYAIYGSGTSTNTNSTAAGDPITATLTIPAGGVGLGIAWQRDGAYTWIWTNLDEDYDYHLDGTLNETFSGASKTYSTLQSSITISADPSGVSNSQALGVVAYGPA